MLCAKYDYDLDIQVKQEEAFANGLKQGIQQGFSQGIEKGISQGLEQGLAYSVKNLLESMSIEQVASALKITTERVKELSVID